MSYFIFCSFHLLWIHPFMYTYILLLIPLFIDWFSLIDAPTHSFMHSVFCTTLFNSFTKLTFCSSFLLFVMNRLLNSDTFSGLHSPVVLLIFLFALLQRFFFLVWYALIKHGNISFGVARFSYQLNSKGVSSNFSQAFFNLGDSALSWCT